MARFTIITADNPWNRPDACRQDLYASLTERERKALDGYREPVLDRVASALGSERFLFIEISFVFGCLATVVFAALWSFYR